MSDVTIIGLGAMGAALAKAQLDGGHDVIVWNRSPAKAEPLKAMGAKVAPNVAQAIAASPVTLICIDNYEVSNAHLSQDDVVAVLPGRIIVQLSTGTPQEARDSAALMAQHGASYLDGAIMAYPGSIGAPDSLILIGGDRAAFDAAEPHLKLLGGDLRHLGDNIAAAAAVDLAHLATSVGVYMGVAHGALICESEGVGLDVLASTEDRERPRELTEIIHADAFELGSLHDGASVEVWSGVIHRLQSQAKSAGINSELPDFLNGIYRRAIKLGHGGEDIAALSTLR